MKQQKNSHASNGPSDEQLLDSLLSSSSATDCTGLIPTALTSQAEEENYNAMYAFLPEPVVDHDKKQHSGKSGSPSRGQ